MDHSFGNWVRHRRKGLDLTQQELARRVGCSVSLIFKIESDERRPSRQIAELLAEHLSIPHEQQALFLKVARQVKGVQHLPSISPPSPALTAPAATPGSDPFKGNLPSLPAPLVGREHEIGMVLQQLQDPDCRLLTLTGPGGVGKTRLALEAAHQLRQVFRHGVYFVSLMGTASAEFIVPAIADTLNFAFTNASDPKAQLFHFLKGKHTLLVLDNLEHLLKDIQVVSSLLEASPDLKILATSREKLNLRAEWALTVQGLPVPTDIDRGNWEANSAVSLFLQRARQVKLNFTPTEPDLPYIESICQLVEGLPLGLELAAAWVRTLSCREIAQEIESNLDFLTSTTRDIPRRHHSMRAVFDYSWHLLEAQEQRVLMKLSVFRGGFTRQAAAQVAGATLPVLASLVDKSLIHHDREQRYDLHELIRQHAYEQLLGSGKLAETCGGHFAFFLELVEASRSKLRGEDQLSWLNLLEQDHDNLRAALEWSLRFEHSEDSPSPEKEQTTQDAFRFAGALYLFWRMRTHWSEGRQWLQRILAQPVKQTDTRERARALNTAVLLAAEQTDTRAALQLSDQNLALARELGDPHIVARAFYSRGLALWKQKDYAAARECCERAAAQFRELGNRLAVAGTLQTLGRIAMNQHNLDLAQGYLSECADLFREFSNRIELNVIICDLGLLAYLREDFAAARRCHERSLALFREAGNITGIEMSLNRLADVARAESNYAEAEQLYSECMSIYRETGDQDEIASLLHNLGCVATFQREHSKALSLFREALALQCEMDNQAGIAECLTGVAGVYTAMGQVECAARLFGVAEVLRENAGTVLWPANRLEYERYLARLRESTSEEKLRENWSQGRSMPIVQAIAEAERIVTAV